MKRDLLEKVGGLNSAYNGAQDYDFVLRATEQATKIKHIPGMMYHWRAIESSTALNPESKGYAYGWLVKKRFKRRRNAVA